MLSLIKISNENLTFYYIIILYIKIHCCDLGKLIIL